MGAHLETAMIRWIVALRNPTASWTPGSRLFQRTSTTSTGAASSTPPAGMRALSCMTGVRVCLCRNHPIVLLHCRDNLSRPGSSCPHASSTPDRHSNRLLPFTRPGMLLWEGGCRMAGGEYRHRNTARLDRGRPDGAGPHASHPIDG